MTSRTISVTIHGTAPKRRFQFPTSIRELGRELHPESVTEAWYAADCPDDFNPHTHGVSRSDCLRWRLACFLRGCKRS